MIKIKIPLSRNKVFYWIELFHYIPDNRKLVATYLSSNHMLGLKDRIAKWFKDNNIAYDLEFTNGCGYILFKKESDAILFKLTFSNDPGL